MGYFQVRYDSRGANYDRRGFIRLATVVNVIKQFLEEIQISSKIKKLNKVCSAD